MKTKRSIIGAALFAACMVLTGHHSNAYIKCNGNYVHTGGQSERMGIAHNVTNPCSRLVIVSCKRMNTTYCWKILPGSLEIFGKVDDPPSTDYDVIDTLVDNSGSGL